MPALWLLFAITVFTSLISHQNSSSTERMMSDSTASVVAGNLLVYKSAVAEYLAAHPGATGKIADASLNLPTWYRRHSGIDNYAAPGRLYVYYAGPDTPGLASEIQRKTQSPLVGKNVNGLFVSTRTGPSGLALPAQIPTNATVIMQ